MEKNIQSKENIMVRSYDESICDSDYEGIDSDIDEDSCLNIIPCFSEDQDDNIVSISTLFDSVFYAELMQK